MEGVYIICFFITGLFFGSFFCCLGTRLITKDNFITGKSKCDNCFHPLKYYDMIPVISYLSLKGKCRYCHQKISILSTFIELSCGLCFAISYYSFGFSLNLLLSLVLVSLSMIIFTTDLKALIIPDEVLIVSSLLILILKFLIGGINLVITSLFGGLLLFAFMFMLMKFGENLFKKEALGGGDVKLLFVLGLLQEALPTLISIFLASFIALPISFYLLYKNKEHVIPFGPFLLIGFMLTFFMKLTTNDILTFFSINYML